MRHFMKTSTLSWVILLIMANQIMATTTGKIAGVVKDGETGQPLPGVNVIIMGTSFGASTDVDGRYFIINLPAGKYDVQASMIGYRATIMRDVQVISGLTAEVDYNLALQVLEAEEAVEVVAERPVVQRDLTSGRSIVSSEEIENMPVESVSGVIGTKAGVITDNSGGLHIRGGRSGEVVYMIDGVPMTNPAGSSIAVSLENQSIQELQILSGTFNAEYGQAMSGIINIVTKEGSDKYAGAISSYIGDYYTTNTDVFEFGDELDILNMYNINGSLSGPMPFMGNKFSFFLSGRHYKNGGYIRGIREHDINDVTYLSMESVLEMQDSPYGRAGLLNFIEPYEDYDGNGELAPGSESYIDFDGNGEYDVGEPWRDVNLNGRYDHPGVDFNGDGNFDPEELEFIDINGNGILDGDPFRDANGNNVLDGEPYLDFNGNGVRDGSSGSNEAVRMNTSERTNLQAKLTWRISPKLKFNYNILHNQAESVSYSLGWKYNPDGRPTNQSYSQSHLFDLTHSLSQKMFYNLKAAFYINENKTFWHDLEPDELTQTVTTEYTDIAQLVEDMRAGLFEGGTWYGDPADSLLILQNIITLVTTDGTVEFTRHYPLDDHFDFMLEALDASGYLTSVTIQQILSDTKNALFLPQDLTTSPDYEYYGGGHSHSYTMRRNKSYFFSGALTWQLNNTHQLKTGLGYKVYDMEYLTYYVYVNATDDWIPDAKTTETSTAHDSYDNWMSVSDVMGDKAMDNRSPREFYTYIQDKIELVDMIVNLGLRYDYFNPNYFVPSDYQDPDNPQYFWYTAEEEVDGEIYVDTLFSTQGEITNPEAIITDARNFHDEPWLSHEDFYEWVEPTHQFSPRIGIAYPITDRGIIHFSYGHFFQIPTFSYLYANPEFEIGSENYSSIMGNAALQPQKTVKYEIGLQQQIAADIAVTVTAFYNDMSGLLGSTTYERYNTVRYGIYSNTDYGSTRGITIELNKRRSGLLSGSLDYTYQEAKGNASDPLQAFYANQSDPPQEIPKIISPLAWDQRHTINANLTLSQPRNWSMTLLGRFGTGFPYTPSGPNIQVDKPNSDRRPTTFNVDMMAQKDVHFAGMTFNTFVKVYNLLDRLNENSVFNDTGRATYSLLPYTIPDDGDKPERHSLADYLTRPAYYSSPRQFRIGVSYNF